MKQELALSALHPGETAVLRRMLSTGTLRRRLRDLGFVEGARLRCTLRGPGGDPCAYAVGGGVFALRRRDSALLLVEREEG